MKLFDKYRLNQANDKEKDIMTEQLIKKKFDNELREQFVADLASIYNIHRKPKTKVRQMNTVRWIGGIAAALLIGIISWQVINNTALNYQNLTDDYLAIHHPNSETRKGVENVPEKRMQAITAYNSGDFNTSARLREEISQSDEVNQHDFLYLGLSHLYQDPPQLQVAITAFQKALDFPKKEVNNEVEWFLALAYLKTEQVSEAKLLLQKRADKGGWNSERATTLLKSLK